PHDGVPAVLRRGHFHRLTGVYLQIYVVTGYFSFYLGNLRRKGGKPSTRRRGGIDASYKAVPGLRAYAGYVESEYRPGSDLGSAAVNKILQRRVPCSQGNPGNSRDKAEGLSGIA